MTGIMLKQTNDLAALVIRCKISGFLVKMEEWNACHDSTCHGMDGEDDGINREAEQARLAVNCLHAGAEALA